MKTSKVFKGSDLKLNIHIEPLGGLTMDDYQWEVKCYCSNEDPITITKSEARRVDENNYIIALNTQNLSVGSLQCIVTALIPDEDFEDDGFRTEIQRINTNINIVN